MSLMVDCRIQNGVRLQAARLAGLRPSPAPSPTFREGLNVFLTGTKEIQKVHAHVFAGLADAQEDKIVSCGILCATSTDNISEFGKSLDCVLCVVVVPRHAIIAQECKEFVAISLESLPAFLRCVSPAVECSEFAEEPLDLRAMLAQEMSL